MTGCIGSQKQSRASSLIANKRAPRPTCVRSAASANGGRADQDFGTFGPAVLRRASAADCGSRTHQKSLLASVARAGSWWNFDVYYAVGTGAAEDANLRAHEADCSES